MPQDCDITHRNQWLKDYGHYLKKVNRSLASANPKDFLESYPTCQYFVIDDDTFRQWVRMGYEEEEDAIKKKKEGGAAFCLDYAYKAGTLSKRTNAGNSPAVVRHYYGGDCGEKETTFENFTVAFIRGYNDEIYNPPDCSNNGDKVGNDLYNADRDKKTFKTDEQLEIYGNDAYEKKKSDCIGKGQTVVFRSPEYVKLLKTTYKVRYDIDFPPAPPGPGPGPGPRPPMDPTKLKIYVLTIFAAGMILLFYFMFFGPK